MTVTATSPDNTPCPADSFDFKAYLAKAKAKVEEALDQSLRPERLMADQAIHWLFPTPVLQVDLTPTAEVSLAMEQQLALFDREVFSHPEFSDRNNLTGDLLGKAGLDQLHRLDAFQWLNQQLAIQVDAYLRELLGPNHALEVHIQTAWPVVCARQGGTIEPHTHRNAQLSAVFYVRRSPTTQVANWSFRLRTITSAM